VDEWLQTSIGQTVFISIAELNDQVIVIDQHSTLSSQQSAFNSQQPVVILLWLGHFRAGTN
jgi:hypothetical protein